MKLWGGRFSKAADGTIEAFTASLPFDRRMALQDVRGSIAHVRMLGGCEIIPTADAQSIEHGLREILGELAYAGLWFDPLKEDLEAFIGKTQERVTGEVRLRLFKGGLTILGRRSPWALYSEEMASFDTKTFDQRESAGTVRAHGLQARMYRALRIK